MCAHQKETTCITFNKDGDLIYTGGGDGFVKVWKTSNIQKEQAFMTPAFKGAVTDVSASLNDEYVVASSTDQNKITLFRTKTSRSIINYIGH